MRVNDPCEPVALLVERKVGHVADVHLVARGHFIKDQVRASRLVVFLCTRRRCRRRNRRRGPIPMHRQHGGPFTRKRKPPDLVELGLLACRQFDHNHLALNRFLGFFEALRFFRRGIPEERGPFPVVRNHQIPRRPGLELGGSTRTFNPRQLTDREVQIGAGFDVF